MREFGFLGEARYPKVNEFLKTFICNYVSVCVCVLVRGQECRCLQRLEMLDLLELELQVGVSSLLSAGNLTWILWKSSIWS